MDMNGKETDEAYPGLPFVPYMCFGAKTPVPKMVLIAAYLSALIFFRESYIEMPNGLRTIFIL